MSGKSWLIITAKGGVEMERYTPDETKAVAMLAAVNRVRAHQGLPALDELPAGYLPAKPWTPDQPKARDVLWPAGGLSAIF